MTEESKYEKAFQALNTYINMQDDSSLSDTHKEYLTKIAELAKNVENDFNFTTNVVIGISYLRGYLQALQDIENE